MPPWPPPRPPFPAWAATPPAERLALVEGILAQYDESRLDEMARAISLEMGAPIDMARASQAPCLPWHLKNFLTAFERSNGSARWAPMPRTTGSRWNPSGWWA
jgi:acyl-CoA reductase-like NAD-dependent aldehyde dehydrogenase